MSDSCLLRQKKTSMHLVAQSVTGEVSSAKVKVTHDTQGEETDRKKELGFSLHRKEKS